MADRSDEATLASLAPAPPDQPQEPSKVKRRDNKSVEDPDEATLASLSAKAKLQGLRPRYDREPRLLHTCVLGFEEGAEDPMQSGEVNNTQSQEITEMQRNSKDPPPVTKTQRFTFGSQRQNHWTTRICTQWTPIRWSKSLATKRTSKIDATFAEVLQLKRSMNFGATDDGTSKRCCLSRTGHCHLLYPTSARCVAVGCFDKAQHCNFREPVLRFLQDNSIEALRAFLLQATPSLRSMLCAELGTLAGIESGDRQA